MTELGDPTKEPPKTNGISGKKKPAPEPEPLFGDDDLDVNEVGGDPDDILAEMGYAHTEAIEAAVG